MTPAGGIDETTVAQVEAQVQRRLLRAFVARGHIEQWDAKDMLGYLHSGFSVDASVRIESDDRAGLERLLRYCARPPFSLDRLRKQGNTLVYRCSKQHSEPVGGKVANLTLTPLELIDPHCGPGAASTQAPAPLLRRAGAELTAAQSGHGFGRTYDNFAASGGTPDYTNYTKPA